MPHGEGKRSKRGGTFAEMRAKARAGQTRGKTHSSDRFAAGPSPAQSVAPKNVNLIRDIESQGSPLPDSLEYHPRVFN